jgi:hypothetical protein
MTISYLESENYVFTDLVSSVYKSKIACGTSRVGSEEYIGIFPETYKAKGLPAV